MYFGRFLMLVKISKLWFEEVATTGNTDLTLPSFATKLFKEGNLYNGDVKVDSILDVLSNPEAFSALAEVKLGKSVLKKDSLEVLKFENTKEAIEWLAKCTNNINPFGPNGSDAFAPFYISTDGCNFKMIMDCKTHQGTDHQRSYHSCVTLPDFVGDAQFAQLSETEIKKLCEEMCFPVEAYIKKEKKVETKEEKKENKEGKTFLDESPDLGDSADEHFEKMLRGLSKEKTPKFKFDPLPEKVWMKKKQESGDRPNRFKRERLHKGEAETEPNFDDIIGINFFSAAQKSLNKGVLKTASCDVCDEEITVAAVPEPLKLNCKECSCPPYCKCECTETECKCSQGTCDCTCIQCTCEKHEEVHAASKISREDALKLAEYVLEKRGIKTASTNKEAYSLFENYGETVKCPNCEMAMVKVRLAGGLSAIYCTTCKHADYDGKIKSRVNAGNPSVEKKITLNCLDSGNCEIKK